MLPILEPTVGGCLLAAGLVVAGAPLFGAGLRTLRLRRHLRELQEIPLAEAPSGFVMVSGRVALDGPLVGPLSGAPCAGYVLEIRRGAAVVASIPERRTFRLIGGNVVARVLGGDGAWSMEVTAERQIEPGDALTENLTALLDRAPEVGLLRRSGVTVTLLERSLRVGQECAVIGVARHGRPFEVPVELERTGTDATAVALSAPVLGGEPDLWIGSGGHLEFLKVSDRPIDPRQLAVVPWNMIGLGLGPLLTLAGLYYLTRAADLLRSAGR